MDDYHRARHQEHSPWVRLYDQVKAQPDNVDLWDDLISQTIALAGYSGLTSATPSDVKDRIYHVFDDLLSRYPLFFGYWKQYADCVLLGSGKEECEKIYERAVQAIPVSVDVWIDYVTFAEENWGDDIQRIRKLYARGGDACGRDFMSHRFWDKFISFEESKNGAESIEVARVLESVTHLYLYQYAAYFERFIQLLSIHPPESLVPAEILEAVKLKSGDEDLSNAVYSHYIEAYGKIQEGVNARWKFESEISRAYFLISPLESSQVRNWYHYLTYEESCKDFPQIKFLYERCLVPGAFEEGFWLNYIKFLISSLDNMDNSELEKRQLQEDIESVFQRAITYFIPSSKPKLRHRYVLFLESQGSNTSIAKAKATLNSYIISEPSIPSTWKLRIQFERRTVGNDAAIRFATTLVDRYFKRIAEKRRETETLSSRTVKTVEDILPDNCIGTVISELTAIHWKNKKDILKAGQIFKRYANRDVLKSCCVFWTAYFRFLVFCCQALSPNGPRQNTRGLSELSSVVKMIVERVFLPYRLVLDIVENYLEVLKSIGSTQVLSEDYFLLNIQTKGPIAVQSFVKRKLAKDLTSGTTEKRLKAENGRIGTEDVSALSEKRSLIRTNLSKVNPSVPYSQLLRLSKTGETSR